MAMGIKRFACRPNIARAGRRFDRATLAERAGVPLPIATNALSGVGELTAASYVKRLADALHVHEQWLTRGDIPIMPLWKMLVREQHRVDNVPGLEGRLGYVIVGPGRGIRTMTEGGRSTASAN